MADATHPLANLVDILKQSSIGSPFYIYDGDGAQSAICDLTVILKKYFGASTKVFLPVFANPCFPLLDLLVASAPGVGVLVNSLPELSAVGAFPWRVTPAVLFAGGVMAPADVRHVCSVADIYYAASWTNFQTALATDNRKALLGLRIDISDSGELQGIPVRDIRHILSQRPEIAAKVAAIHAYQGPNSPGFDACLTHADALLSLSGLFPELRQINFSGGWPFDYTETSTPLPSMRQQLCQYLSRLRDKIATAGFRSSSVEIVFEPGKFLLAAYGYFFCRVIEELPTGPCQSDVHLDASFVHLPSLKLKNRQHAVSLFGCEWKIADSMETACRLRGCSGLSTDFLMPGRVILPKPRSGDYLVVHDVGVYGWAGSYNFLGLQRPPEYVCVGGQAQLVRQRQSEEFPLDGVIPLEFAECQQTTSSQEAFESALIDAKMGALPLSLAVDRPYESNPSLTELGHTTTTERDLYCAFADEARNITSRLQRPISILDVCAASGGAAWHIKSAVRYRQLVLVDIDPLMCEASRMRVWGADGVEIVLADAVEWHGSDRFDLVLANSAYHHIEDDRKVDFLANLAAHLAPGGIVLVGEHFLPDYADGDLNSYQRSVQRFYEARVTALQEAGDELGAIDVIRQTGRYCWERRYEFQVSMRVFVKHVSAAGFMAQSWKKVWPSKSKTLPENSGTYLVALIRQ